jgi:hypothetical protein
VATRTAIRPPKAFRVCAGDLQSVTRMRYNFELDPTASPIATNGSKRGHRDHLMLGTLDRGDTVIVPTRPIRSTSTAPSFRRG